MNFGMLQAAIIGFTWRKSDWIAVSCLLSPLLHCCSITAKETILWFVLIASKYVFADVDEAEVDEGAFISMFSVD